VLEFAATCAQLEAIACTSTAYVAGRREGVILEDETSADAERVNSYEQSKHEMEDVARQFMRTLPVSLFRLSTIMGRSDTGEVTGFNAIHQALRLFYQGLAPMVPGTLAAPVDMITLDFAARALEQLVMHAFEPGRTYHLCAGATHSWTLDELLDRTIAVFERVRPAWRKRRVERPAVVDEATYALFLRSVEESGNAVLRQATRAVQAFAWQLAHPKTFDTTHARAALLGTDIAPTHPRAFFERVVAYCVETNWGRSSAPEAAA
jgi:nucleoside-diphosphate-sugar epimerase